jgi:hypothetical protein
MQHVPFYYLNYISMCLRNKSIQVFPTLPDQMLRSPWTFDAINATDQDIAIVWPRQSGKHVDGGGFACAVRSEKAKELPLRDTERNSRDGRDRFKVFGKIFNNDGVVHMIFSLS